ncbi:MAG: phosphate starvation-inducible protein PhoH [Tissierellia bacterium]|nr:phosphate starvation-inducible protein PhoH [Tissierellia bacterium]
MGNTLEKEILIEDNNIMRELFGELDENINIIEKELNVRVKVGDGLIKLIGSEVDLISAERLMLNLIHIIKVQKRLEKQDLRYAIRLIVEGKDDSIKELLNEVVCVTSTGKSIKPKTLGQKRYLDAIRRSDIVFGIGPAGTGKTYLAVAMAAQAFKNKEVNRIILTRPAVEAGESLGFLPGDLQEKIDPYLRPIYDALFDILGYENYIRYMEKGLIEVAPLAYMRGRTLDNAYVILDEAQNTTNEQMKMFLTRLGYGSKAIITGDVTQVDLPKGKESGLKTVLKILKDIEGIDLIYLSKFDIVRHPLVQRIIEAFEKYENK